jgi:hypothetical protein
MVSSSSSHGRDVRLSLKKQTISPQIGTTRLVHAHHHTGRFVDGVSCFAFSSLSSSADSLGGFLFFRYLQREKSDLLDFRAVGDKWQIVDGWLRDRLKDWRELTEPLLALSGGRLRNRTSGVDRYRLHRTNFGNDIVRNLHCKTVRWFQLE